MALRKRLLESFPEAIFTDSIKNLNQEELIQFYQNADAILVGTEKITAHVVKHCQRIQCLSKYGVGIDNIDFQALKDHQIEALLSFGTNKISVAELTLSFILGLLHNVFQKGFLLKQSIWDKNGGSQLFQKKVGIIGYGHVGQQLHQFLKPFNCQIYVNDIKDLSHLAQHHNFTIATKEEIYQNCQIITLHVPLEPSTHQMIDAKALNLMNQSSILINTARGKLIDIEALEQALKENKIAAAALDVFPQEPPKNSSFLALENLMVSPHIAGNSQEAQWNMGLAAIEKLERYFNQGQ